MLHKELRGKGRGRRGCMYMIGCCVQYCCLKVQRSSTLRQHVACPSEKLLQENIKLQMAFVWSLDATLVI